MMLFDGRHFDRKIIILCARKGQSDLATLGLKDTAAADVWNVVLFDRSIRHPYV
jgi:rhodanese-related sulfurtransferase